MTFSAAVVFVMAIFLVLGGTDRILHNRFGLGAAFEEGFYALGPLALGMIGITCLSPLLADILTATAGGLFSKMGADVSMAPAMLIPIDTGCYPLAHAMTSQTEIADFSSIIVASMLAATITFSVPVSLGIIKKEDHPFLALGTLSGLVALPAGCLAGGLVMGLSVTTVMRNLLPIICLSLILATGLIFFPKQMITGFTIFAQLVTAVITFGLVTACFQELTGIIYLPGLAPLSDSYEILGGIAIMLAGAYPMVAVIRRLFVRPLQKAGALLGINSTAAAGLLTALTNNVPMFSMVKDMDNQGKTINFAFSACAAFALGDHLGFSSFAAPHMIGPMICAKLTGGVIAIGIAKLLYHRRMMKPVKR